MGKLQVTEREANANMDGRISGWGALRGRFQRAGWQAAAGRGLPALPRSFQQHGQMYPTSFCQQNAL